MEPTGSSSTLEAPYDVFLSFRGKDTRDNFTDCLYRTMDGQGIVAYRDSEDLHAGDRLDHLLKAVGNCKICIIVLSKGYAHSAWCLRELARAMELNESTGKPAILPIFFDVMPSDVKLRTELYKEDLEKHEGRHGRQMRQQWEAALRKVGEINGWEVQGKPHGEVIELVVGEVLRKLKVKQRPLDSKLVGVDEQVEAITELLDVDSDIGVRLVGIYGMGGIGKTTLAKIVFNELCPRFDDQCSFIGNIRESSSSRTGLVDLQKQLAADIFDSRFVEKFIHTNEGIDSIRRRASSKKVLIVLDDLDRKEQLKKLVGGPHTFGQGSRIIITTRNKQILDGEEGVSPYEVKQMDHGKALELFSLHAFKSVSPPHSHWSLSHKIVNTTGGLPLALEVIGSYLCGQNKEIWKEMLKRLKNVPHDEVWGKLKVSYDALQDEEKEIFLDIACLFIYQEKSKSIYYWEACNLYPHISLKKLTDLCLIKIVDGINKKEEVVHGNSIWMHDLLRDLGRYIVRQECAQILTGCSRLWNYKEALEVIRSKERKDKVQALDLGRCSDPIVIVDKELERMPKLRFLKLSAATFAGDINNYLQELRWLSWSSPPLDCRMANLHLKNLVVFELGANKYTENWGGWNILKMANKLKVLSLIACEGLKRTPDFSRCLSLERLNLHHCSNLQEVDCSIGKLKGLTHLDIIQCESLRNLPKEIGGLVNLKHFSMHCCYKMEKLPYSIGKLASLSELDVSSSQITSLPDSIGNMKDLSFLDLSYTRILKLPISIGELMQLKFLSLDRCGNLEELPESIGNLTSLQKLYLSGTNIVDLPDSMKNLKQLKVMKMDYSSIRRLPTSIGMLERLEELHACNCKQLAGELPTEIGKLSSLSILDISCTHVCVVPTAIYSLMQLQKLDLMDCNELQVLPKLPKSLNSLHVKSTSLQLVMDLSNLKNLVELYLSNGSGHQLVQASSPVQTLQFQWVGKLFKLEKLFWGLSNVPVPLTELGCLPRLKECTLSGTDNFDFVVAGPQFSNLKNLFKLHLYFSPLREIQFDGLELLRHLAVSCCDFLEGLSIISSSLRNLNEMEVSNCPKLLEIRFLSTMESLEKLSVLSCNSLGGLWGLSNSKKLSSLVVTNCNGLQVVQGLDELELLGYVYCHQCGSLERLINVPNSKIPNECFLIITGCAKLGHFVGIYREMILRWTTETFNEEDEMEENDHIDCFTGILECFCDPLSFFQGRSPHRLGVIGSRSNPVPPKNQEPDREDWLYQSQNWEPDRTRFPIPLHISELPQDCVTS